MLPGASQQLYTWSNQRQELEPTDRQLPMQATLATFFRVITAVAKIQICSWSLPVLLAYPGYVLLLMNGKGRMLGVRRDGSVYILN